MSGDEAREHHRKRVNDVLRRPGIYGRDEIAERLLLEAMAAVDAGLDRWVAECDRLRERGAFTATGVQGAYSTVLPVDLVRPATASMYAEIAHRCGWLDLDRALSKAEYQQLTATVGEWVSRDRALSEVVTAFGPPSLWIGSASPGYPKTLAYTTADPADDLVCFHGETTVLAVRHRPGDFARAFSFTPEGLRRRPGGDQRSSPGATVWIFTGGGRARLPAAVFETAQAGLDWAAEHRVTGILTEYRFGGAYDAAVSEGRFTPSKAHHGTAEHVAGFGPGLRHLHLTDGQRD